MQKIRWAITATGGIAHQFVEGMAQAENAEITAISSSSIDHARTFAEKFNLKCECYDSLETMLKRSEIDVVYICTPNHMHYSQCMECFRQGVSVLCEKPLADNAEQARELVDMARRHKVFFLEGMWTRFFPVVQKAKQWLSEGRIGEPRTLIANFGANQRKEQSQWRTSSSAAGGALRDVGIYPIAFSYLMFGPPDSWTANCTLNAGGVDADNNIMLRYRDGKASLLSSSLCAVTPYDLIVVGTEGQLVISPYFWKPQKVELFAFDGTVLGLEKLDVFEDRYHGSGFEYEIMAVGDCLRSGKTEAEGFPLDETLKIARLIDDIRKDWGVVFEADEPGSLADTH